MTLSNLDLDSGKPATASEYTLADETYVDLMKHLSNDKFEMVTPDLRQNLLKYFAAYNPPVKSRKDRSQWSKLQESLTALKSEVPGH